MSSRYLIVGGGGAAASAIEGIRAHDRDGAITLVSRDNHLPYRRPLLSRDLWFGRATLDDLALHDEAWYRERGVELMLRREAVELDTERRLVWDDRGAEHGYEKLLLATGSRARLLDAPGSALEGVHYFRSLEDCLFLEERASRVRHALVVGGGFIAMELSAALRHRGLDVTLLLPEEYPLRRLLPRDLGLHLASAYRARGIEVISGETVVAIEEHSGALVARTPGGNYVDTELMLVGAGVVPHDELAEASGLEVDMGIEVDEFARTSDANVYAAGDVAEFPCPPLQRRMRCEHWRHALEHGYAAGANMAGANLPYDAVPAFDSAFFEHAWEGVGELDASSVVEEVWDETFHRGVLFYLRDEVVRGVLLWNRPGLVEWARGLVREGRPTTVEERAKAIPRAQAEALAGR